MLVSAVVDPECFGPATLSGRHERLLAELLLRGVVEENIVLLSSSPTDLATRIANETSKLDGPSARRLQAYAVEICKNKKRCIVSIHFDNAPDLEPSQVGLWQVAKALRADLIVCCNDDALHRLRQIGQHEGTSVECCTLAGITDTLIENRRRGWLVSQPLDQLEDPLAAELVGRAVRYATEITIADKMIGPKTCDYRSRGSLRRFVRGIVYVAERWRDSSPFSGNDSPLIRIVTEGGGSRAGHGAIDPAQAEQAIKATIQSEDVHQAIKRLEIELKQESDPPVFRDRFIQAARRCWQVTHGLDDIGKLALPRNQRSPTNLMPDCQTFRDNLAIIRRLPSA